MNILIDTHLAVWALFGDEKLSKKAREIITDSGNTIFYSTVTTWEILLKHSTDPRNMSINVQLFLDGCKLAGFIPINLENKHVAAVETLTLAEDAPRHKDPFDRLLIAQAKCENMLFLTHDGRLKYYNEPFIIQVQ